MCLMSTNCGSLDYLEPSGPVQTCKGLLYLTVSSPEGAGLHCEVIDLLGSNLGHDPGFPGQFSVLRFSSSTQMPLKVAYNKLGHDHTMAVLFRSMCIQLFDAVETGILT
jgi:hypothetical protein